MIATLILQEMSLRLSLVGGRDLAEALREGFTTPVLGRLAGILVLVAVTFGCAAFETGNLIGAALGLETIWPVDQRVLVFLLGLVAALLLLKGSYRVLESILIAAVLLMSLAFLATLFISGFRLLDVIRGALIPSLGAGGDIYLVIALIGTTVVPYNLFLHASAVRERFSGAEELTAARTDAVVSIVLGGIISGAIVLTAAGAFYQGGAAEAFSGAADMAAQLEPLLGRTATMFFSIGLLAAGLSSGITAPMAAAYATQGILGWEKGLERTRQRVVALAVVATGVIFGLLGLRPVPAIMVAQAANGVLLPVVAIFLLWVANDRERLGEHSNGAAANMLGGVIVLIAAGLGLWALLRLAGAV